MKYGVLIRELRIDKLGKIWTITTVIVFIILRLTIGLSVVYFNENPVMFIILMNQSTLFYINYLVIVQPFKDYDKY